MKSMILRTILIITIVLINICFSQSNYDYTIINGVKFELFTDTTIFSRGSQDGMSIHEKITNLNGFPISITFINQHKFNYEIFGSSGLVNYFPQGVLPMSHTFNLDSGETYFETNSWDMKDMSNQFVSSGIFTINSSPDPHSPSIYNHTLSVNVDIDSSWCPIVSPLPNPIEVNYYQPTIFDLDNYVVDNDDPDSSLIWQILDSPGISANINSNTNELDLFRSGDYAAFSSLKLKVTDSDSHSAILNSEVHLLPPNDQWNLESKFFLQDSLVQSISVNSPFLCALRENQTIDLYDISIPDTLIYKSTKTIPNRMYYAKTFQNRLFVACATVNTINNISIYNINNPLIYLNEINEGSNFRDFYIKDSICYVLKHDHILKIYNLSNIHSIILIDSIDTGYNNYKICIKEDVMFILVYNRILMFSISDPLNPQFLSEYYSQAITPNIEHIFYYQDKLYISDYYNLIVIDISDIYYLSQVSKTSLFYIMSSYSLSNNFLFIAENYNGIKIFDLLYDEFFPYFGFYDSNQTSYSPIEWVSPYAYTIEYIVNPNQRSRGLKILKSVDPAVSINEPRKYISSMQLYQNYPNPFNPTTTIKYKLPKQQKVKIEVFNLLGQKISTLLDKQMSTGNHEVKFTADNLTSGVYLYRIQAGQYQEVRKMVFIK